MNVHVEHHHFVHVSPEGTMVYILCRSRDEFDRIALPCTDHGENENGHVLSKLIEKDGLYIVFQYWEARS